MVVPCDELAVTMVQPLTLYVCVHREANDMDAGLFGIQATINT